MANLPKSTKKENKSTCLKVQENNELLKFLLKEITHKNRSNIKSILARGQVLVDNEVITQYNHPLAIGQEVIINWTIISQPRDLKILHEDPYLIVIEKKEGLLSVATAKEKEQTAYSLLSDHVKQQDPKNKIFIVHRLDKDTSGVMMFAKSKEVQELLQNSWKEIVSERKYVVVVEGSVKKEQGTIISWLKESKTFHMHSSRTPNDGQKAVTHYQVLKKNKNYSLLEVELETGRKNQIRVHMQDLGHSIVGDKKYSSTKNPINRLGLHARVLAFLHPKTGKTMRFETEIPKEFLRIFN